MADENKKDDDEVVVAEFKISMHCNACERSVAKAISKVKGVEKFTTDMNQHKVTVMGKMSPKKVLKKLKKKTGKRVEMLVQKDDGEDNPEDASGDAEFPGILETPIDLVMLGYCIDADAFMIFNDDNPNACSIM